MKITFYRAMSILFFITGFIFGFSSFMFGTETAAVGTPDEDGYVQTLTDQVDYKLFLSSTGLPWFLCAFFGYCDSREEATKTIKEIKEIVKKEK